MAKRPCLTCGTPATSTHCPTHTLGDRTNPERQRRAAAVATWRATHGNTCPGYNVDAHTSIDLTADHVTPRSTHGDHGPLTILCRSCNARRRADDR